MFRIFNQPLTVPAVLILLFAAMGDLEAQAPPPAPLSDAEIIRQYRERCELVIREAADFNHPRDFDTGNLYEVAADLYRGTDLFWAKRRLKNINEVPSGNMFWMIPMALVMKTGEDHFDDSDWALIRRLWRNYFPYRGDTENHWVMYYSSLYIVSEMFPDAGPEAWYNGKSSRENMKDAREFLFNWVKITTAYGQGEYDSPNYIGEYTRPMSLLAGWAIDPEMKQLGRMMLDYILLDYAVESLNGVYGGAHSRIYPRHAVQPALGAGPAHGWLFFNQGEYQRNASNTMIAMSGYTPPTILYRIANDRDRAYVHKELKRTRWRIRHFGDEAFKVDGKWTTPVYKYSYVHPDYILGSSQGGLLQPIQQQTWNLKWHLDSPAGKSNTFFGVQPYSNPKEGTMYFGESRDTVTDLITRSKVDYDSPDKLAGGSPHEQVFQYKSTLIALYDIPPENRFPLIHTFYSRDIEGREEHESGWIFGRGGPVNIAYYPLASGEWREVDWTGLLKSGAGGWISTNFGNMTEGSESYVSTSLKNGYIVQVASVSEYDSMEAFQEAILALPLEYALEPKPAVSFTGLDGKALKVKYGEAPVVGEREVDYSNWKLFDGPFSRAERESRTLEIIHGKERLFLDFRNMESTTTTTESSR